MTYPLHNHQLNPIALVTDTIGDTIDIVLTEMNREKVLGIAIKRVGAGTGLDQNTAMIRTVMTVREVVVIGDDIIQAERAVGQVEVVVKTRTGMTDIVTTDITTITITDIITAAGIKIKRREGEEIVMAIEGRVRN